MKTLLIAIYLYCLLTITSFANSTVITFITDGGDWKENSSWDLNRIPKSGDLVIIPAGKTVEISTNQYNSVPSYPLVDIEIYGVLQFVGTGQLNIKCESTLCTFDNGIILSTGCNCNQITMGPGLAPWKGSYPSVTNGQCVLSACNTSLPNENLIFDVKLLNGVVEIGCEKINEMQYKIETIELERSSDGFTYSSIQTFSTLENEISYIDYNPLIGVSYYRLKVNFTGGPIKYSNAKKINANKIIEVKAYPNPTSEANLNVNMSAELYNSLLFVSLLDQYGVALSGLDYSKTNFGIRIESLNPLESGLYTILLTTTSGHFSSKVIIQ